MKAFDERTRALVPLGTLLGSGGEAEVYRLLNQPGLAAKLYHTRAPTETVRKLSTMLANPPDDPSASLGHQSFAWPQSLLVNERDVVIGYVMPIAAGRNLLTRFNPRLRARLGVAWNWHHAHTVAYNLAASMGALHERAYVIGDVNESNVLVTDKSFVTLIDADSFQVTRGDVTYRCRVGKPEYTPPELQRQDFTLVIRSPAHDRFGLAVLIFQLLMDGSHPFRCAWLGQGEQPKLEERIANGLYPYDRSHRHMLVPPTGAPPLAAVHPGLVELFNRCFIAGHYNNEARPDARLWMEALLVARQDLRRCTTCGDYFSATASRRGCHHCASTAAERPAAPAERFAGLRRLRESAVASVTAAAAVAAPKSAVRGRTPPPGSPPRPMPPTAPPPTPPLTPPPARQKRSRRKETPAALGYAVALLVLVAGLFGDLQRAGTAPDPAAVAAAIVGQVGRQISAAFAGPPSARAAGAIAMQCEAVPVATRDGATIPWRVRFFVDSIDVEPNMIQLNIRLERTAAWPDQWTPLDGRDSIWLQSRGGRAALIGQGGVFAQETALVPGETYTGWLRFERPGDAEFELVHPNVQPRLMLNVDASTCATVERD